MRYAYYTLAFLVVLTLSVMGYRGSLSTRPPIEIWPDMDHQAKYKPQAESKFFADGRADRPIPAGTVPYGRGLYGSDAGEIVKDAGYLRADDARYAGKNPDGSFVRFSRRPRAQRELPAPRPGPLPNLLRSLPWRAG